MARVCSTNEMYVRTVQVLPKVHNKERKSHARGFQNSTNEIVVAVGKTGEVPLEDVFMAG